MRVAVVVMIVFAAQQEGAEQIDAEAGTRDHDRLIEGDRHRRDQALDAFVADQQRDHGERDGAGEGGEVAELAGAEGEPRIVGSVLRQAGCGGAFRVPKGRCRRRG